MQPHRQLYIRSLPNSSTSARQSYVHTYALEVIAPIFAPNEEVMHFSFPNAATKYAVLESHAVISSSDVDNWLGLVSAAV
jgi:hypothetical protein